MTDPILCGVAGCEASARYHVYLYQADYRGAGAVSFERAVTPHLCHAHAMEELRYGHSIYSGGSVDRPATYVPIGALPPIVPHQAPQAAAAPQVETIEQEDVPTPIPQSSPRERKGRRL